MLQPTTLKQVQKQMKGFPEELIMYVYHHMNGRENEAQSYLQEWESEQEELRNSFYRVNELDNSNEILSDNNIINECSSRQYPSPNTIIDDQEQGSNTNA